MLVADGAPFVQGYQSTWIHCPSAALILDNCNAGADAIGGGWSEAVAGEGEGAASAADAGIRSEEEEDEEEEDSFDDDDEDDDDEEEEEEDDDVEVCSLRWQNEDKHRVFCDTFRCDWKDDVGERRGAWVVRRTCDSGESGRLLCWQQQGVCHGAGGHRVF